LTLTDSADCSRDRLNPFGRAVKGVSGALLAVLLIGAMSHPSLAAGEAASLTRTRQQIAEIRKRLAEAQGRASKIKEEVGLLDRQLGTLNDQISAGQRRLASLESDIRTAQAQISELQTRFDRAAEASNQRARKLYKLGPAQSVAILFSAESIGDLARAQLWMEKAAEVDSKTIVDASRLKSDLVDRQNQLGEIKASLDAQKIALQKRKDLAAASMQDRSKALEGVEAEIAEAKKHVEALEGDSRRLTDVLKRTASKPRTTSGGASDVSGEQGAVSKSGFVRPVSGRLTSPFGRRWGRAHSGVDLDGNTGDPIRATKAGTILGVSCGGGYGICTLIDHGGGVVSLYAHMSQKVVASGRVDAGQLIGKIGCSGSCTGSHIHFEIRVDGTPKNPLSYF
jgi:murein DD-endopeptidase MepM/ murein hydrolase activator NlpD